MYTANLRLSLRRDVSTGAPKCFLFDIKDSNGLVRDHAWVEEWPNLIHARNRAKYDVIKIEFSGEMYDYKTNRTGEVKTSFKNVYIHKYYGLKTNTKITRFR